MWLVSYSDGGGSGGGGGGGGGAASGGGGGAQQGQSAAAAAAPKWSCLAVLEGHSGPVTSLAALRLAAAAAPAVAATGEAAAAPTVAVAAAAALPRLLLVSTAGDADVIVWGCSCAAAAGGSDSSADAAGTPQPPPPAQPAWAATAAGCYGPGCWCEDQRIHVGGGGANKMVMATSAALTPLPLDPEWWVSCKIDYGETMFTSRGWRVACQGGGGLGGTGPRVGMQEGVGVVGEGTAAVAVGAALGGLNNNKGGSLASPAQYVNTRRLPSPPQPPRFIALGLV